MKRFVNTKVFRADRFSLGTDQTDGQHYLSIPVANRLADYDEYYRIEPDLYSSFMQNEAAAAAFAQECRKRLHDDRLILAPGSDRGSAI